MATPPSAPIGQQLKAAWSAMTPYAAPPAAAAIAITPVFYGFMAKTAQQMGDAIPPMSVQVLKNISKAGPVIGAVVGIQLTAQRVVEQALKGESEQSGNFAKALLSSAIVGGVSAPGLAVFNGLTMSRSMKESLKNLSARQAGAIMARETSFLFAVRISGPVGKAMRNKFGDNKLVENASTFATGVIGSLVGHPADTALTCWQNGTALKVHHLMRGATARAVSTGAFTLLYRIVLDLITPDA